MTIFGVLELIGGLALFLYGMNTMGDGLVKLSGGKLEKILEKLTKNRLTGLLLGAGVTAIIQSSSATTVMVVGFVNSGIMQLSQAVGVIMGANIGTTITSWMLSLTGIDGSTIFLKLLKPSSFTPVLALIGIILLMLPKASDRKKDAGTILLGFAVLMFGMETMSSAVSPLKDDPNFTGLLTAFSNPILGLLAGAVLTAVIQSSSASVGILQALCLTGSVSFGTAIPIIMGQNIGTCVTAIISSVGASKNAKRASMIHLSFNVIGTALFMIVFYAINAFVHFDFLSESASPANIAVIHSLFNIGCAIVLFPFGKQLENLSRLLIRDKKTDTPAVSTKPAVLTALDERFLDQPAFAMQLCRDAVCEMAKTARDAFKLSLDVLCDYSKEKVDEVIRMEEECDNYEDVLGSYLVKLSARNLAHHDSQTLSILLHCISDFERISDHAINVTESAQEMHDKEQKLTKHGMADIKAFGQAITDILDMTVDVFINEDLKKARSVEPLEEVIDSLEIEMKHRHMIRLRKGKCTLEAGLILEDLLINFERVSDHCSNIAVCLIEVREDVFDTHEYLNDTVKNQDPWFQVEYDRLKKQYVLPD